MRTHQIFSTPAPQLTHRVKTTFGDPTLVTRAAGQGLEQLVDRFEENTENWYLYAAFLRVELAHSITNSINPYRISQLAEVPLNFARKSLVNIAKNKVWSQVIKPEVQTMLTLQKEHSVDVLVKLLVEGYEEIVDSNDPLYEKLIVLI